MNKTLKIAIAAGAVVVVLAIVILSMDGKKESGDNNKNVPENIPEQMLENQSVEAAQATQELINDVVAESADKVETINTISSTDGSTSSEMKVVTVAPGTSPININSGEVVTKTGEVAKNDSKPGLQDAPQSSFPIEDLNAIPKSTIKLDVTSNSFTPKEFTVKKGQAVSLAITNVNESTYSETFFFDDASLSAVAVGVAKGQTKTITFNAPDKAGEYTFYSNMFDHRAQGAEGKMIVK
jgi:plastocyanin